MSEEEKTSRRLQRMEARKEEAIDRKRKEAEMEKLEIFLERERERNRNKAEGRQIRKYLEKADKRAEEKNQAEGQSLKKRRQGIG